MAQQYNLAELHGGPLDGQVVQTPVRVDGQRANPPKPGRHWWYAYARTLPGYPTLTQNLQLDVVDDGEPTA